MSSNFNHTDLLARLNEKADQYTEEAEGIHDDVVKLTGQVAECQRQVKTISAVAALIEQRIGSALEVDRKTQALADAAADSARKSASAATQAALTGMLDQISAVTAQADTVCKRAGRRMLLANAWGIISIISAIVGCGAGAAFMHHLDADRFMTVEQAQQAADGRTYAELWQRASVKERELLQKIIVRPAPRR